LIERYRLFRPFVLALTMAVTFVLTIAVDLVINRHSRSEIAILNDPRTAAIAVEIRGAVQQPGLYRFTGDARIADLIDAAGGVLPTADMEQVNLARRLEDASVVVIPERGAATPVVALATPTGANTPLGIGGRMNVNVASEPELESLPGIGPVLAQRIIDYRTAHGPFRTVDDLAMVDGISANLVDDLRTLISVGP
jgi:competence protein ComEA